MSRRFQFSLKWLFVAIVAIALLCLEVYSLYGTATDLAVVFAAAIMLSAAWSRLAPATPKMAMPHPQFSLQALLVAMLIVAVFFGGMALQRRRDTPVFVEYPTSDSDAVLVPRDPPATMTRSDGSTWLLLTEQE